MSLPYASEYDNQGLVLSNGACPQSVYGIAQLCRPGEEGLQHRFLRCSLTPVCLPLFESTTHHLPLVCLVAILRAVLQVQQGKDAAVKQATTAKKQAESAKAEVQKGRHEQQKLNTFLDDVLVSPPAFHLPSYNTACV